MGMIAEEVMSFSTIETVEPGVAVDGTVKTIVSSFDRLTEPMYPDGVTDSTPAISLLDER